MKGDRVCLGGGKSVRITLIVRARGGEMREVWECRMIASRAMQLQVLQFLICLVRAR